MISMTWPQYRRRQCRIGDFVVRLSPMETELLSTLLVRYPHPVTLAELIESAYPDPEREPDSAEAGVAEAMRKLGRKVGAFRIEVNARYCGYRLCQTPEDVRIAA